MAKKEEAGKILAAISYLWIIGLILLLVEKKDKFVKFHAKQGTAIFAISVILIILGWIPIINLITWIGGLILLIAIIYGIIMALQSKEAKMPVINDLGEKIAEMLNIK